MFVELTSISLLTNFEEVFSTYSTVSLISLSFLCLIMIFFFALNYCSTFGTFLLWSISFVLLTDFFVCGFFFLRDLWTVDFLDILFEENICLETFLNFCCFMGLVISFLALVILFEINTNKNVILLVLFILWLILGSFNGSVIIMFFISLSLFISENNYKQKSLVFVNYQK